MCVPATMYDVRACTRQVAAKNVQTLKNPSASPSSRDQTSLYVGFLPVTTTQNQLFWKFQHYGEIKRCHVTPPKHGMSYTYGFVQFKNPIAAMTAAQELHNTKWGEFSINVQWERPSPVSGKEKRGNLTETGNTLMERMKQFEQTTIDAEITQGSSQPPMMKNTRMNCRHTLKCQIAVDEAVISIFDKMTIPCVPIRIECSDLLTGTVLKDSGYESFTAANGGSNSVSSVSTPVMKITEHADVMAEQSSPDHDDSHPVLGTVCLPAISLTNELEECGVQVKPVTIMRESNVNSQHSDDPPPLEPSSFDSMYLPPSAVLPPPASTTVMNEARSHTNAVEIVLSNSSHSSPTALCNESTSFLRISSPRLGVGRGTMLFKLLESDLKKPKPVTLVSQEKATPMINPSLKHLAPIGRGKMLSSVLEQLPKEPLPVGNIRSLKVPATNWLPSIPLTTDEVDEAVPIKLPSVPKQACASVDKPRRVRIAAVFPGVDVKNQASKAPAASVVARKDHQQGGRYDLSKFKTNTKKAVDAEFLTLECSRSYSPTLERHGSSSPEYVPPDKQYQALSSGDELEFRENRQGRSSGDLEINIAMYQRNIRRWQIELKRIQQKNTVLTEEVKKEGNGEDLDLDGDVSVERVHEINRVLELHAQLAAQTELLRRRDIDRELILMKGHQQYMNDKLAVMENALLQNLDEEDKTLCHLRLSLEAEEIREKLTLAKLESRVLQMKSEFFL